MRVVIVEDDVELNGALERRLRGSGATSTALFLTAKDSVAQRVDGFEAGGDDYLLGLPIVTWITDVHGGTITLKNRPEGGAKATLTLPG